MKQYNFIDKIEKCRDDERPLYVVIYEELFDLIKEGYFEAGQKLPGETTLAERMGVSRGSLRQALLILQEDGIIYNHQGKGNFVSMNETLLGRGLEKKGNIVKYAAKQEAKLSEDIEVYFESPNNMLQNELQINANQIILVVKRVYMVKNHPAAYIISFIPYDNVNKEKIDMDDKKSVVNYADNELFKMVSNSKSEILLTKAGDFMAERLDVEEKTPMLLFEEDLYKNDGQVLAFLKQYFLPDYFTFLLNRK